MVPSPGGGLRHEQKTQGKNHVMRIGASALAVGACLLLAGCGGGGSTPIEAGGSSAICSTFEQAYQSFQGGATPPLQPGNAWDELINASGQIFGTGTPSGGLEHDIFNVMNVATSTSDDLSNGHPISEDVAHFNSDLKQVGQDCKTTLTPATASAHYATVFATPTPSAAS
jgi:hypothetical protein